MFKGRMDGKQIPPPLRPSSPSSLLIITLTLCIILMSSSIRGEDEHQPEIFLPPRNFNPHPYYEQQQHYGGYESGRTAGNTGPVLFPGGEGVANQQRQQGELHPVDLHPYAKVADKHRYKARGRFNIENNRINPNVYNALDAYAKKVLKTPASSLKEYINPRSLNNLKKPYKFSYKVLDHLTGDDFSHTQSQTPQATLGEYKVKLPDGRIQTVSYTADKDGYKAVVKYTEDDVTTTTTPSQQHIYDNLEKIENFGVTAKPVYYSNDYGGESVYFGSKLAPYVVEGRHGQHGEIFGSVYEGEVYDPRQVVYRK